MNDLVFWAIAVYVVAGVCFTLYFNPLRQWLVAPCIVVWPAFVLLHLAMLAHFSLRLRSRQSYLALAHWAVLIAVLAFFAFILVETL